MCPDSLLLSTYMYTPRLKVGRGTVQGRCLAQEQNTVNLHVTSTRSLAVDYRISYITNRLPVNISSHVGDSIGQVNELSATVYQVHGKK